jgi:hypothetical protein
MEIRSFEHYKPLETALIEMDFKVDKVIKQRKKTLIFVSKSKKKDKKFDAACKETESK